MKRMILLLIFVIYSSNILSQINQGDVLINTFDTRWLISSGSEFVVLVNTTNVSIDLNGYEIQTFGTTGEADSTSYYRFITSTVIYPDSFLLISTFQPIQTNVDTLSYDLFFVLDAWAFEGYITLRKQNPTSPSDYLDIIKHSRTGYANTFSGFPDNSGLTLSEPALVVESNELATRGGVSGIDTLRYTGYGNFATDFITVIDSNAGVYIRNAGSVALPVELSSFSAVVLKTGIKLNWQTETEVNNYGFDVERKVASLQSSVSNWDQMGFVNGSGNSNSPKSYSFEDRNVTSGKYLYRLKQIDNDGKYEYSKIIEVDLNVPGKFELSQNYPNPFNPTTTIKFSLPKAGYVKLTLYNILAQEIKTLINESKEAGVHTVNFNASDLNSGLYIYKLEANGLTQTRKMTLVK